ncbi:NAD(P)/FAD-dependent oxidoreductase [Ruania alba]|uniref:3-phenylpropionate/trans-cinnamate dioxygenase ferredoxin reductase subunit n=1 Tax=Ruania alba TaxID=648782 RepID=A0A1H5MQP7_9MICO|nr:FAD-dependent oxidoreductase [Ruania alba]SEE91616.1 3-phenylpropionate/trans-cinnamate dioxygenase ferredoxin reductase subunit [Ruania alba]
MSLVLIGAGLAAATAVTQLREAGDSRPVTIVGDEGELPYERPGLSKGVLLGAEPMDSVFVHDAAWYAEHDVRMILDDAAVTLDIAAGTVGLTSGDVLDYDDVILATGATARRPPIPGVDLPGVHTLRRIPDSRALRQSWGPGRSVVVVGGGWIGLETAAAARLAGADVTVLEAGDVPLHAALGPTLGEHFAALHRSHGVDVRTGVLVTAIEGDGAVSAVRVGEETIPADVVVLGVGAAPNVALAEHAGLAVDDGIVVDDQLRAAPHVYAIGDVATTEHASGGRIRVEHWDNAIRQGRLAAQVLRGEDAHYDWSPYFFTDQYDLGMEYVGRSAPEDEVTFRGDPASGEFLAFWTREDVLTAAMNVNIWDVSDDLRSLLGRTIAPDRLADPGVGLTEL